MAWKIVFDGRTQATPSGRGPRLVPQDLRGRRQSRRRTSGPSAAPETSEMVNRRSSWIAPTTEPGTAPEGGVSPASVEPLIPAASVCTTAVLAGPASLSDSNGLTPVASPCISSSAPCQGEGLVRTRCSAPVAFEAVHAYTLDTGVDGEAFQRRWSLGALVIRKTWKRFLRWTLPTKIGVVMGLIGALGVIITSLAWGWPRFWEEAKPAATLEQQAAYSVNNPKGSIINQGSPNYGNQTVNNLDTSRRLNQQQIAVIRSSAQMSARHFQSLRLLHQTEIRKRSDMRTTSLRL